MSKELDRLINHCETQIRLATEFGDKQHKKEHEDILKIINEYKQIKLDFELYKDNHSYPNYDVEKLKASLNNPLRGIFAEVTDDVLLRSNAMNYGEAQDYKKTLLDIKEIVDKALETGDKQ